MADTFPSMYIPKWRSVPGRGLELYDAYSEQGLRTPPVPSPDGLTQEQRMQDPEEYIRRLIAETNRKVTDVPEGEYGYIPFMRPKASERNLDDARQRRFMDEMIGTFGAPSGGPTRTPYGSVDGEYVRPESWSRLSPEMADAMERHYTQNSGKPKASQEIDGRYEYTGLLGPGSPLNNAMVWLQSTPAMAYSVAEGAANKTGDAVGTVLGGGGGGYQTSPEEVYEKADTAAGTFMAPLLAAGEAVGVTLPRNSTYSRRQDVREANDAAMKVDPYRDVRWLAGASRPYQDMAEAMVMPEAGEDMLNRYGADEMIGRLGTAALGAGMDAMLNPIPPDLSGIVKSTTGLGALGRMGAEFGLDGGNLGYRYYTGEIR